MIVIDLVCAYLLDLLIGDPHWLYHPVRLIGAWIHGLEPILRRWTGGGRANTRPIRERWAGIILAGATTAVSFGAVWLMLRLALWLGGAVGYHLLNIYLIYTALATRCLAVEAVKVRQALSGLDLTAARQQLGMLVGRETTNLTEPEVIRAVVETTAENTVDGVIAPLCYAVLGGCFGMAAPLVYAFKAVSTLDSMVGYKNERYQYFGWASAKLDDGANFLPARLTGLLIPCAAGLLGFDSRQSFRTMLRDRRCHDSPNCAYPEAAVAGALGIQLGGANVYFGRIVAKPTLGDPLKPLEAGDIGATVKLLYVTSLLGAGLGLLILYFERIL